MRIPKQFTPAADVWNANIERFAAQLAADAIAGGFDTLTKEEELALVQYSRFGSLSTPVWKNADRPGWTLLHPAVDRVEVLPTKAEATFVWEVLLAKWRKIKGHASQQAAIAFEQAGI